MGRWSTPGFLTCPRRADEHNEVGEPGHRDILTPDRDWSRLVCAIPIQARLAGDEVSDSS